MGAEGAERSEAASDGLPGLRFPSSKNWLGHSRGQRCEQPLPRSGLQLQRLVLPAPEGPPLCPCTPQSQAQASGRGRRGAGLHLLDQAPALRGFAQEPPVVVGVGCGPILLLLGLLRRPAPASETQGPGVSGATVHRRIPAHPELGGSSSSHLPPSASISERHIQNTMTVAERICDSFLSRFSKLL